MKPVASFLVASLCAFLLGLPHAGAGEPSSSTMIVGAPVYWLRINQGDRFSVVVNEQVTDGCWLTSEETKAAALLELARSGYLAAETKDAEITLFLSALGWDVGGGLCAVSYNVAVFMGTADRFYSDDHEVISLVPSAVWSHGGLVTAGKQGMHSLLKEKLVGGAQAFLVEVARNQKEVLKKVRTLADDAGGARLYWARYEEN